MKTAVYYLRMKFCKAPQDGATVDAEINVSFESPMIFNIVSVISFSFFPCTHARTHTRTHARARAHTHTHTHTHTYNGSREKVSEK